MEKKTNAKVAAPKTNGKKAAPKTAAPAKAAEKKIEKRAAGPLGKTTGKSRTAWFVDFFATHKGKIPADDKILMIAVKEFGEGNVGKGTVFTPTQMRGWFNCFCKRGSRGLTKKDMILETSEVTA
jgi:hypothetical protein